MPFAKCPIRITSYNVCYTKLLRIDKNLDWAFGKGHLVILGDVFDRGAEVTELLWLIRKLEQQALEAGGMVHFVLGNHEFMTMQNDLRYINKKYRRTEQLLNTSYPDLYGINTVMGRWLRSKPTRNNFV